MHWFDLSLIDRGGPIMWVLLVLSLFGFIIFLERGLFLHKTQVKTDQFLAGIKNNLRNRRLIEALTVCETVPGPVASVVKSALLHYNEGEERMRMAIQAAALVEIPIMERRIGTLAALARVAPLLGLIGTVIGMTESFFAVEASTAAAYPSFGMLLGGLAEALLTTLVGLVFAVMAHFAHHFLHGRVRALVNDMEYAGHNIMEFVLFNLPAEETAASDGNPPGASATSEWVSP